jgi:uncharacterized protein YegP (UPF0339 family)
VQQIQDLHTCFSKQFQLSYMAHPLRMGSVNNPPNKELIHMRTISTRLPAFILAAAFAAFGVAGCAQTDADDYSEEDGEASAPPSFDLWRSENNQWYFHLVAANGNNLLSSEGYTTRTAALNGILSVLDHGGLSSNYEVLKSASGKYYLRLKAANNQVIAITEQYSTKSSATRAVGSCTRAVGAYLSAWEDTTAARAQVFESAAGAFRFNVYAANGQIVLTSESYTTEAAALNGAFSVVEVGTSKSKYEIRTSTGGSYYFVVKGANGEIVGTSQMYTTRASADRAINDMIALLPNIDLL